MTTLRLACREQETFENALQGQIADFELENSEIKVECTFRPIHDHYTKMVKEGETTAGDFDLFMCCTDWLPEAIFKGQVLPLNSFLAENPPPDWPHGWHPAMRELQSPKGVIYGLPWHDGPEVLHYRKDLFENETERENYLHQHGKPLVVPETWDDFLKIAQFFTRPEEDLWGCVQAAYTDGHNNVYDFLIGLWSRSGALFDPNWNPRFHEQAGIDSLQFYHDLFHFHRVAPPEGLSLGSVECGDLYAQGKAAMSWNWIGFAAVTQMPEYSKIVGKNGVAMLPKGTGEGDLPCSLNIYWVLSLCQGSNNKEAAYRFMQHISQPKLDKLTSMVGANGTRLSTWNDPEVRGKYPQYELIELVHQTTRTLPAIHEYPDLNEAISQAVHRVMHEGAPVEESLVKAADECREILVKSGRI